MDTVRMNGDKETDKLLAKEKLPNYSANGGISQVTGKPPVYTTTGGRGSVN